MIVDMSKPVDGGDPGCSLDTMDKYLTPQKKAKSLSEQPMS